MNHNFQVLWRQKGPDQRYSTQQGEDWTNYFNMLIEIKIIIKSDTTISAG